MVSQFLLLYSRSIKQVSMRVVVKYAEYAKPDTGVSLDSIFLSFSLTRVNGIIGSRKESETWEQC